LLPLRTMLRIASLTKLGSFSGVAGFSTGEMSSGEFMVSVRVALEQM
jgi:hypothetical protein